MRRFLRSVQGKLVGWYLLLTAVSLATITVLVHRANHDIILSSVEATLGTIVRHQRDLISGWMKERVSDVAVLARNPLVVEVVTAAQPEPTSRGGQLKRLDAMLRLVQDQYAAYHEVCVIDLEGNIMASSRDHPTKPAELPKLLGRVRSGRPYTSPIRRYPAETTLSLDLATAIRGIGGGIGGVVVARIDLGRVNEMTNSASLMKSGEAYLVDQRGVFITHRDQRRVFRDRIARVRGVGRVISGQSGVDRYTDYRGIAVLGAYEWLPRWGWGLMVEVDTAEAFAPDRAARGNLFLVVGLTAAAVLLGTLLVVRRITRPLADLTSAVQAVASGRLDQRLASGGRDEVAYLNECFNQMARSLAESRSAMDERIEEATRSLADKNTELQRANEELQQANSELEQQRALLVRTGRLAATGEMAAGIAHEINNPLTTMRNLIFSLGKKLTADDERQKDIAIVTHEIERINKLIQRFLRYAQPRRSRRTATELEAVVRKTLQLIEPQVRQGGVAVRTHLEPEVPEVLADAEQIEQVVLNLLLNAVQASEAGSEIVVHTRITNDRMWVELAVIDHGVGIPPAVRDQLFLPFFTTKSQGSGLGLAISQRIVEEHGGKINFTSTPGEGTTFIVTLPVAPESVIEAIDSARRAR